MICCKGMGIYVYTIFFLNQKISFTRVPPCLVLLYSTSPCIFEGYFLPECHPVLSCLILLRHAFFGGFHIFTLEDICIHIYDWFLYINTRRHKTRQDKLRRCIELRQPNMTRYASTRFAKINVRMELTCLFAIDRFLCVGVINPVNMNYFIGENVDTTSEIEAD